MFKSILLDLDGTIYRGTEAVPGASDFIKRVRQEGLDCFFVTNRANRSPQTVCRALGEMDIECGVDDLLTSAQATARHLSPGKFYYIGEEPLCQALIEGGHTPSEESPDYVVVGYDPFVNYQKLKKATLFIRAGAQFIGTNPDKVLYTEYGIILGTGAILAALTAATGLEPIIIGKPERLIIDIALRQLEISPGDALLVGDSIETDVMAGHNAGVPTALILTGVSSRQDLQNSNLQPNWTVNDFEELEELVFGS